MQHTRSSLNIMNKEQFNLYFLLFFHANVYNRSEKYTSKLSVRDTYVRFMLHPLLTTVRLDMIECYGLLIMEENI